jgi:hypothetical protein
MVLIRTKFDLEVKCICLYVVKLVTIPRTGVWLRLIICLFAVYITTLSVASSTQSQMTVLLVNNDLERTWKEAVRN